MKKYKVLDTEEAAKMLAKSLNKPVLYLYQDYYDTYEEFIEVRKACPLLDEVEVLYGRAMIVCESIQEMVKLFLHVVGNDGPTKYNEYKGPARVYATCISSEGEALDENT